MSSISLGLDSIAFFVRLAISRACAAEIDDFVILFRMLFKLVDKEREA